MAQKVITTLVDDIDGTAIEDGDGETIRFGLDGVNYEIDLTAKNAQKLRQAFELYTHHGRKVGRAALGRPAAVRGAKQDLAAVREWLRAQGHEVSSRGRIPGELMSLYHNSTSK